MNNSKTRMTIFIKGKLNKSDGQTNIDKYRVSQHKILQNIITEKHWKVAFVTS